MERGFTEGLSELSDDYAQRISAFLRENRPALAAQVRFFPYYTRHDAHSRPPSDSTYRTDPPCPMPQAQEKYCTLGATGNLPFDCSLVRP